MAVKCQCGHIIDPGDESIGKCKVCQDMDNANRQNQQYFLDSYKSVADILADANKRAFKNKGTNGHSEIEYER